MPKNKVGSILLIQGLDNSKPAEYISDQACSNCQNFEVDEALLKKRNGTTVMDEVIDGTGIEIMAGRQFTRAGVAYNTRIGLDKMEVYDSTNTEWDDITNAGGDFTGSTDDIFDTAITLLSGAEILCATNGIDPIQKWTGTGKTADLGGSPPVAKFIQEYKTYLVTAHILGGTDIAERVQWSGTSLPETWAGGNAGSQDLIEDGEGITGLNIFGNYLCVHKPSSIYIGHLVSSSDIFKFDRRATGAGTVANNSIINLPTGEQIFLAKDGIRVFNGITAPLIKAPINEEIRNSLNAEKAHKAYGVLIKEKDEVWIGIPLGSQEYGQTIYKYNYVTGNLYKDTRANASAMWRGSSTASQAWDDYADGVVWDNLDLRWDDISFTTDNEQINIGYTNGFVDKIDTAVYEDNGSSIDATWDSKDFQHSQDTIGRWKKMELWATGTAVNVLYSTDEGSTWTEMSNSPITLSDSMPQFDSPLILYFDTMASKIRFRFKYTSGNALSIKQFIVHYSPREERR